MLARLIVTAIVVLMVLVDFTTWFMSFAVESLMGAVLCAALWWTEILSFLGRKKA